MNRILRISIVVVICLILILGVALLVGKCSNKDEEETTAPPVQSTEPSTQPTTSTTTPTTPPECTHVDADGNYVCDNCQAELERPNPDPVYTEAPGKVYVITTELNVRSSPEVPEKDEDFYKNVVGSVKMDAELERLGYYDNGWSAVIYDGETRYVKTTSITTQKPITEFTTLEETVYLTQGAWVYTKPSHLEGYSEHIATLTDLTKPLTRLGTATEIYLGDDGKEYKFAKIKYTVDVDGVVTEKIGYMNNDYLTTTAPVIPDKDNGITFTETNVTLVVVAEVSINLRTSAEFPADNLGAIAKNGDELQATHHGEASDGRKWYKVLVNDITYYVIDIPENVQIKNN